jgi:uncharacterized protein YndB with AHSA1/START domain
MKSSSSQGEVEIKDGSASVRFTRFLPHPPSEVWKAITDSDQVNQWYAGKAKIDGRPGGKVEVVVGPFHWKGKILVWDPPKVFEYEYNQEPSPEMPNGAETLIRWELIPEDDGTKLLFTHSRLKSTIGFVPGSHVVLDRLSALLDGKEIPDFGQRYGEVESLYPQWSAEDQVEESKNE